MPSCWRLCISMTWATACCAQPSRGSISIAVAAKLLGARIVAHLLQAEGLHAEYGMVAGHAALPGRQRTADSVAQHAGVAGEEIDLVPGLQRQRVERKFDGDILEDAAGFMPASPGEMAKGCNMRLLALRRGKRQRRLVACLGPLPSPRARWRGRRDSP